MGTLNERIASTIEIPGFLKSNKVNTDIVIDVTYAILDAYFNCVSNDLKSDMDLLKLGLIIDKLSSDLSELANPQTNLQCWLWIGEIVTKWIDIAVDEEEFETAANLRKLLNNEYV